MADCGPRLASPAVRAARMSLHLVRAFSFPPDPWIYRFRSPARAGPKTRTVGEFSERSEKSWEGGGGEGFAKKNRSWAILGIPASSQNTPLPSPTSPLK